MKNIRNTILIFLMILFGSNTMITWNKTNEYISLVIVSILVFLNIIHNLLKGEEFLINKRSYIAAGLLITNILFTCLINMYIHNGDFLLIIKIILAIVFVSSMPFDDFKSAYVNALVIFSIYSLICNYIIVFTPVINIIPIFKNVSKYKFYDFGICSVRAVNNYYRNFGPFSEPGVYVCYLIPALAFCVMNNSKRTKAEMLKIIILAGTLITTFSTIGVIASVGMLLIYLALSQSLTINKKIVFFVILIVGAVILFRIPEFRQSFDGSINKMTNKESSFVGRTYSIKRNLEGWMENPLFGLGLHNMTEVFKIDELTHIASSNTSTTTMYMATYGIFFVIIHLLGLFYAFNRKTTLSGILCFGIFVLSINSQSLFHSEIIWYLTFYGFMQGGMGKDENLYLVNGHNIP